MPEFVYEERIEDQSLRILALLTDAYGSGGGIARFNCDLLLALSKTPGVSGIDAYILSRSQDPAIPNLRIHHAAGNRWRFAVSILCQAAFRRHQLILCGHTSLLGVAGFAAAISRAPIWWTIHGIDAWTPPSPYRRRVANRVRLISAVSRFSRRECLSWCSIDPIRARVLPNTVDDIYVPGPKTQSFRRSIGLPESANPLVLTVTRLSTSEGYKGVDTVLLALGAALERFPGLHYCVAGSGDDLPRLEQLAFELGIRNAVTFLSSLDCDQLASLYREADLFVMPSRKEGFGIVYIEAMASGLPTLGLSAGGTPDALADGRLGTLTDEAGFAAALIDSLSKAHDQQLISTRTRSIFGRARFQEAVNGLVQVLNEHD